MTNEELEALKAEAKRDSWPQSVWRLFDEIDRRLDESCSCKENHLTHEEWERRRRYEAADLSVAVTSLREALDRFEEALK